MYKKKKKEKKRQKTLYAFLLAQGLEAELGESRVVERPRPARLPAKLALALLNRDVVGAGLAPPHQPLRVKLPQLVAVRAEPAAAVVVPLVLEAHGDAVLVQRPQLLDQAVLVLGGPLAAQELDDGRAAHNELGAVAPAAVRRVRSCDTLGIARVPRILGGARLLPGALEGERGQRRSLVHHDV